MRFTPCLTNVTLLGLPYRHDNTVRIEQIHHILFKSELTELAEGEGDFELILNFTGIEELNEKR